MNIPQSGVHDLELYSQTERLISHCARDVLQGDLAMASSLVLDWCGIAVAGAALPAAQSFRNAICAQAGSGQCSAVAAGHLPMEAATLLNASLGTLLEMDDVHRASLMHAGDVVVPAALASAQVAQCSGQRFLESVVLGYEIALVLGGAAARNGYSAWYNSATCGVFGAAMAAAHALGATTEQKRDALGHAGMQAGGVWQCRLEPTDSKMLATANAARAGVTAALLGLNGLRGPAQILEGSLGFFRAFYPSATSEPLLEVLPDHWMIHEISFKPWPACRHIHPALGLMLEARAQLPVNRIASIRLRTYEAALAFCDIPHPQTPHEARFSLQHCLAVAACNGWLEIKDADVSSFVDPDVQSFAKKIHVEADSAFSSRFPAEMGACLEVEDTTGAVHVFESSHALGDPELPMSEAALKAKFDRNLAFGGVDALSGDALAQAISALPDALTLDDLTTALLPVTEPLTVEVQL